MADWQAYVQHFDTVDSTMHVARRLATQPQAPAPEGTTVVARCQTHGRGRLGRAWFSQRDAGLWMTCIVRPRRSLAPLASLALVAGASVFEAIHSLQPPAPATQLALKWPNDVLLGQRKLAGVLLEAADLRSAQPYVLVGIGINCVAQASCTALPSALATRYAALHELWPEAHPPPDVALLLTAVLTALQRHYQIWQAQGLGATLAIWQQADALAGQFVRLQGADGMLEGRACGLAADGRLQVCTTQGMTQVLTGEVERRSAPLAAAEKASMA